MSMTDELERLTKLHREGALTKEEFDQAKAQLLNQPAAFPPPEQSPNTLGEAANRYVTLQMVMSVVGFILFLIFFLGVILPHLSGNSGSGFQSSGPTFQFTPNGK